jgi:hypothetical protein
MTQSGHRASTGSNPIGNPGQFDIHVVTLPFRFSHRFGLRLPTVPGSLFAKYNVSKGGSLPEQPLIFLLKRLLIIRFWRC